MPACSLKVLNDSVTTGFTVPLYSQYCMNFQTKNMRSKNFLHMLDGIPSRSTGKMSCSYPGSEAKPPVSHEVQVPYLCKAEHAFCPQVQKSAGEVISVLEVQVNAV